MTVFQGIFLGVIQGLTEFLPISSSGHLVLFQELLGIQMPGVTFEVCAHFGTLLAIFVAFRRELGEIIAKTLAYLRGTRRHIRDIQLPLLLVFGSLPAAIVGIAGRDWLTGLYQGSQVVGWALVITGTILWFSDRLARYQGKLADQISVGDALFIGLGQALALLPGISRSGSTIAFGLMKGLERETAARFSFLLAIPAIGGATLLELGELGALGQQIGLAPLVAGTIAAALAGYLAIGLLLHLIRRGPLILFSYYTWTVGALLIIWSIWK
ncbi:MAG: undecaprenyl-diphosphate phosphatase [Limnochordia bacterium]|jgi:undecaprenyl-diphosphatase